MSDSVSERQSMFEKNIVIANGKSHSPEIFSNQITVQDNTITITPRSQTPMNVYVINNNNQSLRQNIVVNFNTPHTEVNIFGLYQAHDKENMNITTTINHNVPHCTSRQLWKGVLYDSTTASFEGNIFVATHAQKTVAHLQNKNLLLSNKAQVSARPFLEINANDVQCTHGATVGFLDQDALFYLRSRGITETAAHEILIEAFVNEILEAENSKWKQER